ncbi:hypothetical protein [uncultured Arthrobacter sp.]|uniref:hypothetical protein n=1 Tax=uncultured Arthrobacter sp. TaxID=114050 RepID=UPI00261C4F8A|nr:hypothetical protein [uncultured Arthrobacter sp.]
MVFSSTKKPVGAKTGVGTKRAAAATKKAVAGRKAAATKKAVAGRRGAATKTTASTKMATEMTAIEAARRAKARRELGKLDYVRSVRAAAEELDQAAIARELGVSQPSISKLLAGAEARGVKPVSDGFSGAGPYEIAERYAAGDIDRDAMIRELSSWPYPRNEGAVAAAAEWESTPYMDTAGSFAEVGQAFDEGLIDGDAYDRILDASDEVPEV